MKKLPAYIIIYSIGRTVPQVRFDKMSEDDKRILKYFGAEVLPCTISYAPLKYNKKGQPIALGR